MRAPFALLVLPAALALGVPAPAPAGAKRVRHEAAGARFSLELPAGYKLRRPAGAAPDVTAFLFTPKGRDDRNGGAIEVSIMDMKELAEGGGPAMGPGEIALSVLATIRRERQIFEKQESDVQIAGVRGKRVVWRGKQRQGVIVVGIKRGIGFSLHAEASDSQAKKVLPRASQALLTFELEAGR
jgi:hypothetical protein